MHRQAPADLPVGLGGAGSVARRGGVGNHLPQGLHLLVPLFEVPVDVRAGEDGDQLLAREGVRAVDGRPVNFAIRVVLCCYVLQCPTRVPPPGDWMTYREFRNAGPLVSYFTANTQKIIETSFAGRTADLLKACRRLDAQPFEDGAAYDLSVTFDFLPRIPVLLRFNDRDEEFPAQCAVMFPQSAESFLDMECMAIGGTLLAGTLTQALHYSD